MRALFFLLGCLGLARLGPAQNAALACGNGRYTADVFTDVTRTTGVVFGSNSAIDYSTGATTPVTLQLDFYEPLGDAAVQRPLLIMAFGGSFVQGQRQDLDDLGLAFARKGYVVASIDYRLIQPGASGINYYLAYTQPAVLADEIVRAAADMKAAVRFFKSDAAHANTYRIDPTRIFVGGFSAGAITALQVAYTDDVKENSDPNVRTAYQNNGGLEGNTDLPAPSNLLPAYSAGGVAGVFNIAGGVNDLNIVSAGNPPLYSAQGTADEVVPYDCGPVSTSNYTLCGSHQLQAQATQVGIANQLYPVPGGNHSSPRNEPDRSNIIAGGAAFLQAIVCAAPLPVVLTSFSGRVGAPDCAATLRWQTATEQASRAYDVQGSADGQAFATLGTVPSQNRLAGAAYSFAAGPVVGTRYFRLRMLDADGSVAYSPVISLVGNCLIPTPLAVPNPALDQVVVSGLPAGRCQLLLYSTTGQCVAQAQATGSGTVSLGGLPAGMYLVKILTADGAGAGSIRVVKE